jgi:hypothetical protein
MVARLVFERVAEIKRSSWVREPLRLGRVRGLVPCSFTTGVFGECNRLRVSLNVARA